MAAIRSSRQSKAIWYIPTVVAALALVVVSALGREWWSRFGILGGIYTLMGAVVVFGIRSWRRERPLRLQVRTLCMAYGERMTAQDLESHMATMHPDVFRAMKRTAWLMTPTLFAS